MLPALNTDQWIQLGMLALTALGLIGGAIAAVWAFKKRRFGFHFAAEVVRDGPFYVRTVRVAESGQRSVTAVAGWMKFTFFNNRPEPVSVAGVYAYENGSPRRGPVGGLYRKAELYHRTAEVSEPIRLPLRLDSHEGLVAWSLVEYTMPADVGEVLFALYGDAGVLTQFAQGMERTRQEVEKQLKDKIKYVDVTSVSMPGFSVSDPIIHAQGSASAVKPRFGFIPLGASSDFLSHCVEKKIRLSKPQAQTAARYITEITLGDGRMLRRKLRTNRDAFWFFVKHA